MKQYVLCLLKVKKNLVQVRKVLTPLICSLKLYVYERIVHDMRTFFLCEYHNEHYITSCSCCLTPVLTVLAVPQAVYCWQPIKIMLPHPSPLLCLLLECQHYKM
jgi:hypothetical protein